MHYSHKKLGGPVQCPRCGGLNPSGFHDVNDCRWCGKFGMQQKWKELDAHISQPIGVCPNCGRPLFGGERCICTHMEATDYGESMPDKLEQIASQIESYLKNAEYWRDRHFQEKNLEDYVKSSGEVEGLARAFKIVMDAVKESNR